MKLALQFTLLSLIVLSSFAQKCAENAKFNSDSGKCSCLFGYYADTQADVNENGNGCIKCPNNSINGVTDRMDYYLWDNDGIGGQEKCTKCWPDFYIEVEAGNGKSAKCTQCPDSNTSDGGKKVCDTCNKSYYSQKPYDSSKTAECLKCPNNTYTRNVDSNKYQINDCTYCNEGFYMSKYPTSTTAAECKKCPQYSTQHFPESHFDLLPCKCNDLNTEPITPESTKCVCKQGFKDVSGKCEKIPEPDKFDVEKVSNGSLLILSISTLLIALCLQKKLKRNGIKFQKGLKNKNIEIYYI